MNVMKILTLAAGGTLMAGTAALANGPVPMPNGTTITPTAVSITDEVAYPTGCDAIYETFDDTFPPNYGTGWTVSDGLVGCWGPAHKFVADDDYDLCQVLISATHVTGNNQYMFRLHADDAGGSAPGTALGTWDVSGLPQNTAGPTPLVECDATGISLTSGSSYWLSMVASSGAGNSWGVLRQSTLPGNERTNSTWKCSFWEARGTINSGAWRVTGEVGGGRYVIRASGSCPGQVTLSWGGAAPNVQQAIISGANTGSTTIPNGPCQGTVLGIQGGVQLYATISTGSGSGSVNGTVGTGACGRQIQCLQISGCITSNVIPVP